MNNELEHHGILGQKWGVRRYQNSDGSLTPAGIKRYGTVSNLRKVQKAQADAEARKIQAKADKKYGPKKKESSNKDEEESKELFKPKTAEEFQNKLYDKKLSGLSDKELLDLVNRIRNEQQFKQLTAVPKEVSKGKKVVDHVINKIIIPAVTEVAKEQTKKAMGDLVKKVTEDDKKKDKK